MVQRDAFDLFTETRRLPLLIMTSHGNETIAVRAMRAGALDYVVKGQMIGGFALVAYPAEYGVSGIKTFLVSHQGIVYEKDLGRRTAEITKSIVRYDRNPTWRKAD